MAREKTEGLASTNGTSSFLPSSEFQCGVERVSGKLGREQQKKLLFCIQSLCHEKILWAHRNGTEYGGGSEARGVPSDLQIPCHFPHAFIYQTA